VHAALTAWAASRRRCCALALLVPYRPSVLPWAVGVPLTAEAAWAGRRGSQHGRLGRNILDPSY